MKKILCGGALALALVVWVVPAIAASHVEPEPDPDKTINFSGEVRARWEYSENFLDADDAVDDSGDFWPYRARVAADGKFTDNIFGKAEIQAFGFFGDDAPGKSGTTPPSQINDPNSVDTRLYQAYIRWTLGESNWQLKVGRQEYTLGNELHFGDADFYNGTSFDGIRATRDAERWDLDLFYYLIDEIASGADFDQQNELWGATVNFGIGEGDQYIEPYFIVNRQTSDGLTPTRVRAWVLGALWANPVDDAEGSRWDWSAEAAMQGGEVGFSPTELDLGGMIVEGWLGYKLGGAHRIHAGALYASGDDDGTDTDIDGYVPLFTDEHAHNRLGDLDLFGGTSAASGFDPSAQVPSGLGGSTISNVMDLNAGYTWLGEGKQLRASLHNLTLVEDGGAPGAEDSIGNEIDLAYDNDISQNLAFQVGYAHLLAGDLLDISPTVEGDDIMRGWVQLRLRWN